MTAPPREPTPEPCVNCGKARSDHYIVNYADGPQISGITWICPGSVYDAAPAPSADQDQNGGQGHEAYVHCSLGALPLESGNAREATCLNTEPSARTGTDTQQGQLGANAGSISAPPTSTPAAQPASPREQCSWCGSPNEICADCGHKWDAAPAPSAHQTARFDLAWLISAINVHRHLPRPVGPELPKWYAENDRWLREASEMLNKIYSAENTPGSAAQPAEPPAQAATDDLGRICEHGQLARSCNHCDDAREIATLRATVERQARDIANFHMAYRMKCDEQTKAALQRAERAEAERDALRECVRELVACADESDSLAAERLYGKPHTPEYKTRELDHRQRSIEAWKAARAKVPTTKYSP